MLRITCVFLVLLRLAIGWHCFIEGRDKIKSDTWSSEVYLRESSGPLAPMFRGMAGDSLIDQLTLRKPADSEDATKVAPEKLFPEALDKQWQAYFDEFVKHYQLNEDQKSKAEKVYLQKKADVVRWMQKGITIKKTSPSGSTVEIKQTADEVIRDYEKSLKNIHQREAEEQSTFWPGTNAKLEADKKALGALRSDLQRQMKVRTAAMKKLLDGALVDIQLMGMWGKLAAITKDPLAGLLTDEQRNKDPIKEPVKPSWRQWATLERIDFVTKWGLLIVGICLMLGIFTRSACVVGAGFLLLFYLAMPSFPWLPDNPKAEGHYLFINKNIIEMLALLALATTRSGRWLGFDGLLQFINPRRWRVTKETPAVTTNGSLHSQPTKPTYTVPLR